ncbi:MAG: hypothetical protein A3D53_01215 [Candidatus Magasanikbacteria bacterium RIFCSPHIGHO2_02_FULL_45_10]|uniref:Baseplate protein J-like domain-containing protein n=1 Tax=Candidatus Magasanikbacteria bacterium RIFCSPHIGHO2_02_FULL_45_10 TaxID=1798679 RepID=A0A1F6MAB5_9BACT|nr:MAG: hypothetical protein A3D53_01215 [Candidatus Magasanikbacteria bacterium RIFCSPHIGHO2_02_FULL_45_10]
MITHRMSTQSGDSPVKFYKIIALSFLVITVVLLGVIIFITSKKADIIVLAKEDAKKVNMSLSITPDGKGERVIAGTVTSTKFIWSEKYQPTGTKRKESVATGEAIIYNQTNAAQPLVVKTRLLTSEGVLFRLTRGVTVPANGQSTVAVYADKPGSESEIGPSKFIIPGLPEFKQKVIYAESKKSMTGGQTSVAILSEEDVKSAKENYTEKVKQAFLATISPSLYEVNIVVADQLLTVNAEIGFPVSEFMVKGTSTLVVVSYNLKDLKAKIAKEVESKIDVTEERFLTADKKPYVTVAGYNLNDGTADINLTQDALVTIDANVEKLAPYHFLGKNKDEIQRYVLGLDHVVGVDLKFSPSWITTAPTSADKIRVIVKNVK